MNKEELECNIFSSKELEQILKALETFEDRDSLILKMKLYVALSKAHKRESGEITVYTDGGCRGNGRVDSVGAWSYTMSSNENYKEDSGAIRGTTNNIMEMTAVIECLKAIKDKSTKVVVHADSSYVLNGITSWIVGWKKNGWRTSKKQPVENKELWMEMDSLKSQFTDLSFVKVRGHSDNEGNDRADLLCNLKMDELQNEQKY